MNKIYFGLWQDLYTLSWPVRLLIEYAVFLLLVFVLFNILKRFFTFIKFKNLIIKIIVLITTKFVSLVGRGKEWAYKADEKIVDWANAQISNPIKLGHRAKNFLLLMVVLLYIIAILPDLPISGYLDDVLVNKVSVAKQTLQSWERKISNGYSNYLPLFSKKEEEKLYIQVKKDTAEKIKIYKNASKKSKVLTKASKDGIEYKNKFKKRHHQFV